jgi:hypothetical protein
MPCDPHPLATAGWVEGLTPSQPATALAFIFRSTSAYTFVVVSDTCPSRQDRVDVHPGTQEVRRRRVANRVWADALGGRRRYVLHCPSCTTFDQRVGSKSRNRLATPIHGTRGRLDRGLHQPDQFPNRLRPQRTSAGLVPLAPDQNRGQITVGNPGANVRSLIRTWAVSLARAPVLYKNSSSA